MHTGSMLIYGALALSVITLIFLAAGAWKQGFAANIARLVYFCTAAIITAAVVMLLAAFLGHDFSLGYVYQHSSLDLPLLFRISAFWAGQEGGFLLWLFFLYIIGIVIILAKDDHENIVMAVLTVTQSFILVYLVVHNPFARTWDANAGQNSQLIPHVVDGLGLNPLLQDFWMAVHPPVLFAGYAAAAVPFAYAIAALVTGDHAVMHGRARRWVIFTTAALGAGIFLGGYWAYAVLGWGGYWGWDPVENSSLVPWLVLIALVHGLVIQRRGGALVRTNLVLAMLSFVLVLYSTFLTRSGILSNFSVHSFGGGEVSYQIAWYIAFFLALGALLFVLRARAIESGPLDADIASPRNLIVYGMVILLLYAAMILLGTSMPIITGIVLDEAAAVNEGFYGTWSVPAAIIILLLLALAEFRRGGKFDRIPIAVSCLGAAGAAVIFNMSGAASIAAYALGIAAFLAAIAIIRGWFLRRGAALVAPRLAHLGVAVLVLGVIASGYHSYTIQKKLRVNTPETAGNYRVTFLGLTDGERSSLRFILKEGNSQRAVAIPYYLSERTGSIYKEPYIRPGILGDFYLSPVSYASGEALASQLELKKGESKKAGDTEVRYAGMRGMNMKAMMEGKPELYIDLEVRSGGALYRVSPGLRMGASGKLESVAAFFAPEKRRVELQHMSRETGEVSLYVEPGRGAALPPDEVIVEVSHKRLIILVWAATLFIFAGLALAMRRADQQRRSTSH